MRPSRPPFLFFFSFPPCCDDPWWGSYRQVSLTLSPLRDRRSRRFREILPFLTLFFPPLPPSLFSQPRSERSTYQVGEGLILCLLPPPSLHKRRGLEQTRRISSPFSSCLFLPSPVTPISHSNIEKGFFGSFPLFPLSYLNSQ